MAIDAETERMMRNWAQWRAGARYSVATSGAYELEARGRREEVAIPLINGEATDVDDAVQQLNHPLRLAIEEYWLQVGTVADKARRCGCQERTLYQRLDRAHAAIWIYRADLRARCAARNRPAMPRILKSEAV